MNFNEKWNVVTEDEFKPALRGVFSNVAGALKHTLGPYGATTIIEQFGEVHITKDGWTVLKNIRFEDATLNNFLDLLRRVSAQVVYQVGDGSTSAIIAANELLTQFDKNEKLKDLRPKELLSSVSECVDLICDMIRSRAIQINKDNIDDVCAAVNKIAYISTNGDAEIASIISDIYRETSNPVIEYVQSKSHETTFEIINGYTGNITYVDNIFATQDDGLCTIDNGAYVIMFDYKIDLDNDMKLIAAARQKAIERGKKLVVIAPAYDTFLLNYLKGEIRREYQANGRLGIVYCTTSIISKMSANLYNDFSIICGATIISETQVANDLLGETRSDNTTATPETIGDYIGYADKWAIGPKTTLIQGFPQRNEAMYKKIKLDAELSYAKAREKMEKVDIGDISAMEHKLRLSKLNCSMGIIRVGGKSTLEKKATYDLVDDAVRACESAYTYGYNVGGNVAIITAANELYKHCAKSSEYGRSNEFVFEDQRWVFDRYSGQIFKCILDAFKNTLACVIGNKYNSVTDSEKICAIIDEVIRNNTDGVQVCYDLTTDGLTPDIINSCKTDIEILRGALSIVNLINTSNQYISIQTHDM